MTTAFGDTTTSISNFSEIVPIITQVAEVLEMEYAVMGNMVTRHDIPRGRDRVRIMYQTNQFVAEDHTDGEEITNVQQMGIDTIDLTTNMLRIVYRVSSRALRFPSEDLAALCAQEQAKAQAEALEVRLLALLDDAGTQDLGDSGSTATNLSHIAKVRRMLRAVKRADGGPAPTPIVGVLDPFQEEDILNALGAMSPVASSSNGATLVIPHFLADIIQISPSLDDAFIGTILRIPFFLASYIGQTIGSITVAGIGGIFATEALHLGVSQDWETKPFEQIQWDGIMVRSLTDYGARVGPFPKWVVQFDTKVGS